MKKVFLQYNQLSHLPAEYQQRMWDIADFHQQLPYDHEFIVQRTDNLDQAFQELNEVNPDWVVVVSLGHCSQNRGLYDECIASAIELDVPLLCHIMNFPDQYPHLHPQLFAVNYAVWQQCGSPSWNYSGAAESFRTRVFTASEQTFHDDYTPYRMSPTGRRQQYNVAEMQVGAQVIRAFFEQNYTIHNILDPQRDTKFHLYPDQEWNKFNEFLNGNDYTGSNAAQKHYCGLITHLNDQVRKQYYVLNTEALTNVSASTKIDHYAGVASGLKLFCTAVRNGFDDSTSVTFFDFSPVALQFQRAMLKNWDGNLDTYQMHCKKFERATPGHYPCLPSGEWEDTYNHILRELDIDKEHFQLQWLLFCLLDHKFELINIYDYSDQAKLIDLCKEHKQTYLWISNAFYMEYSLVKLGKAHLGSTKTNLYNKINESGANIILDSNDFWSQGLITFNKNIVETVSS